MTSSIYHFFARLMQRRGYFGQAQPISEFDFPDEMIVAKGRARLPDLILKTNLDEELTGGELIEFKDARSMQIPSFNSTIPTAKKSIDVFNRRILEQINGECENPSPLPVRDMFYLIRGRSNANLAPISKTLLVHGAWFETLEPSEVILDALRQVAVSAGVGGRAVDADEGKLPVLQDKLSSTVRARRASISARIKVETQVDPVANLLNSGRFPLIGDDTLSLLVHVESDGNGGRSSHLAEWKSASVAVRNCEPFEHLARAYGDVDDSLSGVTRVAILRHPYNGPFFLAQAAIGV